MRCEQPIHQLIAVTPFPPRAEDNVQRETSDRVPAKVSIVSYFDDCNSADMWRFRLIYDPAIAMLHLQGIISSLDPCSSISAVSSLSYYCPSSLTSSLAPYFSQPPSSNTSAPQPTCLLKTLPAPQAAIPSLAAAKTRRYVYATKPLMSLGP